MYEKKNQLMTTVKKNKNPKKKKIGTLFNSNIIESIVIGLS